MVSSLLQFSPMLRDVVTMETQNNWRQVVKGAQLILSRGFALRVRSQTNSETLRETNESLV